MGRNSSFNYFSIIQGCNLWTSLKLCCALLVLNSLIAHVNCDNGRPRPSRLGRKKPETSGGRHPQPSYSSRSNFQSDKMKANHFGKPPSGVQSKPLATSRSRYPANSRSAGQLQTISKQGPTTEEPLVMIGFPSEDNYPKLKAPPKQMDSRGIAPSPSRRRKGPVRNTGRNNFARSKTNSVSTTHADAPNQMQGSSRAKRFYSRPQDSLGNGKVVRQRRNVDVGSFQPSYNEREYPAVQHPQMTMQTFDPQTGEPVYTLQNQPSTDELQPYRQGYYQPTVDQNTPLGMNTPQDVIAHVRSEIKKLERQLFEANLWNQKVNSRREAVQEG